MTNTATTSTRKIHKILFQNNFWIEFQVSRWLKFEHRIYSCICVYVCLRVSNFFHFNLFSKFSGGPSGPLGDWEQFTRGMGSKLMASMGYVMGAGLGKRSEGRIEPVPAMLYPVGRSLDWCMNLREKAGEMHVSNF